MITYFAASQNLLSALGIDWFLLLEQAVAFAILLAILAKFVYPVLIRSIDARREMIEKSVEEAKKSQADADKAEERIAKLIADARKEAEEIVARSQQEANSLVAEAETKARGRADVFLKEAHDQLNADITKARAALKSDTAHLVAMATERIIREKIDPKKDASLIEGALRESK